MSEEYNVKFNLEVDTSRVATQITKLNDLLTTYVALARRAGLPPDAIKAIAIIQQLRVAVEMAYRSIMLMYTATGPIGWFVGLGSLGISLFMYADTLGEMQG